MKLILLFTICLYAWITESRAQKLVAFIDSAEKTFERINHLSNAVSCDLELKRKIDESGNPYYINSTDTRVDFSFFKVMSLPFYNEYQTEFGTTEAYANWIKYLNSASPDAERLTIQEHRDSGFVILQLSDSQNETLRIISRLKNVFYCISISSKELSRERQIGYLKFYLKTNKRFHNEGH